MNNEQIRALMGELAPVIREYVAIELVSATEESGKTIAALKASNVELVNEIGKLRHQLSETQTSVMELQSIPLAKDGLDGKDGPTLDELRGVIAEEVAKIPAPADGKDGKDGLDGKSVDFKEVRTYITDEIVLPCLNKMREAQESWDEKVSDLLTGANARIELQLVEIDKAVAERLDRVKNGADGKDGTSVNIEEVTAMYSPFMAKLEKQLVDAIASNQTITDNLLKSANEMFNEHLESWAAQINEKIASVRDGKDVDMAVVSDLITTKIAEDFAVIATRVDKTILDLGETTEAKMLEYGKILETAISNIKHGVDGRDGADVDMDSVVALVEEKLIGPYTQQIVDGHEKLNDFMQVAKTKLAEVDDKIANVKDGVDGVAGPVGPQGEPGKDGKDVDLDVLDRVVTDKIKGRVTEVLATELVAWDEMVKETIAKVKDGDPGPAGADGRDGIDVDMEQVQNVLQDFVKHRFEELREVVIREYVEPAIKAIPVPENGKDGRDGANGINLAGMMIDRVGHLQATLSNGEIKDLGPIMGADGLGFEDLRVDQKSAREFSLVFERQGREKRFDFTLPVVLDAGVYKSGMIYAKGDGVTYGGSYWIAKEDGPLTTPGAGSDWRLSVKKGRDAREPVKTVEPNKNPVKIGDKTNG